MWHLLFNSWILRIGCVGIEKGWVTCHVIRGFRKKNQGFLLCTWSAVSLVTILEVRCSGWWLLTGSKGDEVVQVGLCSKPYPQTHLKYLACLQQWLEILCLCWIPLVFILVAFGGCPSTSHVCFQSCCNDCTRIAHHVCSQGYGLDGPLTEEVAGESSFPSSMTRRLLASRLTSANAWWKAEVFGPVFFLGLYQDLC